MTEPGLRAGTFFDREAERYDAVHDRDDVVGYALRSRIATVLDLLGPRPGHVLDCGMGGGRLLVELERRGWSVGGVDVSARMVALARARLPEASDRLVEGALESLPFSSESFDAAVATGVLEYVEDVPRGLAEVSRVLRPGGVFVASMPNPRSLQTLWRQRLVYPVVRIVKPILRSRRPAPLARPGLLSVRRLGEVMAAAGLEVDRVEYVGFMVMPRPLARLLPSATVLAARRLERARPGWRRLLGGQFVVAARKRSTAEAGQAARRTGPRGADA